MPIGNTIGYEKTVKIRFRRENAPADEPPGRLVRTMGSAIRTPALHSRLRRNVAIRLTVTTRISIINYSDYDPKRNASETQVKRMRNASETVSNTDKNANNAKNAKNKEDRAYADRMFYEALKEVQIVDKKTGKKKPGLNAARCAMGYAGVRVGAFLGIGVHY